MVNRNLTDKAPLARRHAIYAREATIKDFDEQNAEQVETALLELQKIHFLIVAHVVKRTEPLTGVSFEASALINDSVDVLASALQMVRQRAYREALALSRIALEIAATAVFIKSDAKGYERYQTGTSTTKDVLRFARDVIPRFAEIWGVLSNSVIHPRRPFYGPRLGTQPSGEPVLTTELDYEIRSGDPRRDEVLISFACLVSSMVLKATELACLERSIEDQEWMQLPGSQVKYFHATDSIIAKYYDAMMASMDANEPES